jgi:hypothetical protein
METQFVALSARDHAGSKKEKTPAGGAFLE